MRPGIKRWNRIGVSDSDGPQKGESGPTPGYSVFIKKLFIATTSMTQIISHAGDSKVL